MHRNAIPAALAAVVALAGAGAASSAPPELPDPDAIAPGGRITAVIDATARYGWPHETTREEGRAIADLARWYYGSTANPGTRVSVGCFLGIYANSAYCGISYFRGKRRVLAFRADVTIQPDGRYLYRRAKPVNLPPSFPRNPEAPQKVDPGWCNGTTEGFCNPVDPSVLAPIPPDAPPSCKRARR